MSVEITKITKRLIISIMGFITAIVSVGWGFGSIETKDALLVIIPLFTGFFSLLKGQE